MSTTPSTPAARLTTIEPSDADLKLGNKLKVGIWVVTILVWVLVGLMRTPQKLPLPDGISLSFLPAVHAILNLLVACFLVGAVVMIKRGNIQLHQRLIVAAMSCSAIFLLCYVAYHFTTPETKYGGEGLWRAIYLIILISHIALAAISFPFILLSWAYGFTNQYAKHRSLTKWVFPIWLYVAVTGPICYLMLSPYYE